MFQQADCERRFSSGEVAVCEIELVQVSRVGRRLAYDSRANRLNSYSHNASYQEVRSRYSINHLRTISVCFSCPRRIGLAGKAREHSGCSRRWLDADEASFATGSSPWTALELSSTLRRPSKLRAVIA
jgi:hypothetical protein